MQATMPRVLSDLQKLYNSELDTYKGAGVKYGAYDEVNSSQSASRKNISELRQKVNAYRSYLEDGAADKILSSLDQMEQGYDAYLFMSSFDSEDSYQSAVRQLGYQKKYEGRSYNEIQTILADMQEGEEKEWLSEHAGDYMTLDEAREKKDSATGSEQLYYNDVFNKKLISQNTEILANTMMEGTQGSVLDEMKAIAEMENGTEKKQRKAAVLSKMEELGIALEDYGLYAGDSNVTWDLFWKWAGKSAGSGLASVGKAITGTADLLIGKPLQSLGWENNPISQTANYYKNDYDTWKYSADLMAAKMGGGTGFEYGGQVIEGTVAAIPDALLAIMTAGTSAAGSLSTKAAYESGNILTKAGLTAQNMAKKPQFWLSYGRTLSSDYEEAKAMGANDTVAALGATISSLINAGIEIGFDGGSGIQGLPNDLADQGVHGILSWVESSLEEGGEELLQGFVNNAVSKVLYDSETELLNPKEMAMDFAMGAAVGGILGGGQMAVSKGVNSAVDSWENGVQNRRNKKNYGSSPENIQALILEGLESAEGSTSKILAEKYQEKLNSGKSLTGAEISKLIDANEQEFRLESIASIQAAAEEKLTELGETGDVAEIARVIAKKAAGETLTRSDTTVLRSSKYGAVMAKNIHANKSGRIDADEYIQTLQATQLPQVNAEAQNTAEAPQELAADASRATIRENRTVEQREDVPEATGKNFLQVAADGVTRQISTGKAVEPKKIVSIDGKKSVIQTSEGEISSEDIEFGTGDTDLLWRSVAAFNGITPNSANGIIKAYKGDMPVATYLMGAAQEFRNGFHNMESGGKYASKLTPFQREVIYSLGQKAAGEQVARETAAVSRKGKSGKRQGKVYFDEGAQRVTDFRAYAKEKGLKLSAVQETAVSTMEKFSAVLGVDFYVYASYEKDGKRYYIDQNGEEKTAPSGKYYSDGRIYIDLYAGETGKGTMLFTVAHELTHFIRQWSPAKFKVLANFLVKVYGSKGVSVNTLVEEQIAKAKRNGRELSWEEAYEEMVADSMEAMLADGNAVQILAELKQEDKTLWQKVCDWFKNLAEDLKALVSAYKGYKPDSNEGKMVAEMQDVISVLESLYAEALADAGENFQAASEEQKNTTQEGGAKFSFQDSRTGMANDLLLPYDNELAGIIEQRGGIIVDSFEKLQEVVNIAFDEPSRKATAYFGILNSELLEQIEKKVSNIPNNFEGKLFKPGRNYSIAASLDSIRHLTDNKGLTRGDVLEYLDRMADTLIENDSVTFDYYTDSRNNKLKGLLFKKGYSDGTMISFEVISAKKVSMNLQTMYMDSASYQKKKPAKTPLVQNTPAHTPEARVSQTSNKTLSQPNVEVKEKLSDRDPAAAKANKVLERENVKLKADVSQLKELLKLQRQVTGGTVFTKSSIEKAARILMKDNSAKGSAEELAGHLDALYSYIAKNEEVSWEGIREAAEPAVTWLREHTAVQRDEYAAEILKELKGSRFYLDESQKQEAVHAFGSYNDFRHQLTGVATATDKGNMSLDSLWHVLSGKYPSIFDPSTSSGDMPRAFAEAVDKLRSMQDGGKSYDVQLAEQNLLRQV